MQPDWHHLRVFLYVARAGSLARAAERIGAHPSTLSRQMSALEETLDTSLLVRTVRGIALTPAGELLARHAEDVEERVLAATRAVAGQDVSLEGRVHLTTTAELLDLILPTLRTFQQAYPAVELDLETAPVFRDLVRREADVALRASPAPPDDAIAKAIAPIAWSSYSRPEAKGRIVQGHGAADGRTVRVSTVAEAHQAARHGLGTAELPCFVGERSPELQRVGDVDPTRSTLWLLIHPDNRKVARVRALTSSLEAGLAPLHGLLSGAIETSP